MSKASRIRVSFQQIAYSYLILNSARNTRKVSAWACVPQQLEPVGNLRGLEELQLVAGCVLDRFVIERISFLPHLRRLMIQGCRSETDEWYMISRLTTLLRLELLHLPFLVDISFVSSFHLLEHLSLHGMPISSLQSLLPTQNLQELSLKKCNLISDGQLRQLSSLRFLKTISVIEMPRITGECFENAMYANSLQSLCIRPHFYATQRGIDAIATMSRVKELDLGPLSVSFFHQLVQHIPYQFMTLNEPRVEHFLLIKQHCTNLYRLTCPELSRSLSLSSLEELTHLPRLTVIAIRSSESIVNFPPSFPRADGNEPVYVVYGDL